MIKFNKGEIKKANENVLHILQPFYTNNHKLRISPLVFLILVLMVSIYFYQVHYQKTILVIFIIIQTIFLVYLFENQKEAK